MKKIIDAGALRSPKLQEYLVTSPSNFAVITDYASMESFKGDADVNIRNSLRILSQFPKQVIILKSTNEITRLRPREKGLHGRMLDEKQTSQFHFYCQALYTDKVDPRDVTYDIDLKSREVSNYFGKLYDFAETIRKGINMTAQSYHESDLKDLRSGRPISQDFSDRIIHDILHVTAIHYRDIVGISKMPSVEDAIFSLPFRYSLCSYALTLKWIAESGFNSVATKKLRNDFTDAMYVAYATFYDGLLTEDKKMDEIYRLSRWMIKNLFSE